MDNSDMVFNWIGIALRIGVRVALLPASHVGLAVPASTRIDARDSRVVEEAGGTSFRALVSSASNNGLYNASQHIICGFNGNANEDL